MLIGVDAGADALLEAGHRPDARSSPTSTTSPRLRCAAAPRSWRTPAPTAGSAASTASSGSASPTSTFATGGTAEDAAILLAHAHHAELIVMVGSHASLVEFLDSGRSGMASSFLTRAAVGPTVVDAKAVARLYRNRVRGWLVFVLVLLAAGRRGGGDRDDPGRPGLVATTSRAGTTRPTTWVKERFS